MMSIYLLVLAFAMGTYILYGFTQIVAIAARDIFR